MCILTATQILYSGDPAALMLQCIVAVCCCSVHTHEYIHTYTAIHRLRMDVFMCMYTATTHCNNTLPQYTATQPSTDYTAATQNPRPCTVTHTHTPIHTHHYTHAQVSPGMQINKEEAAAEERKERCVYIYQCVYLIMCVYI